MTKKFLYAVLMATALFGLVNCAKDGGGGKSTASTPTCSAGSVYHSSYGCLPTTQCSQMGYGMNYGYYQGQCYAGSQNAVSCQGSCGAGQVQTMYGCMQAATSSQCGSQYTCAGYGVNQGGSVPQCVPGMTNSNYYGNNYPQQQYYNPYQYQQQYYYGNPYQYQQQYYNPYSYNNGGLYFYFGW